MAPTFMLFSSEYGLKTKGIVLEGKSRIASRQHATKSNLKLNTEGR